MIATYRYKPFLYYSLTFGITFALWSAGAVVSFHEEYRGLYMLFMLPGLMAPFLLSLVMVGASNHPALKKDFINRLCNLRLIQPRLLPAMVLIMPLAVLASIILSLPLGGSMAQFQLAEEFSFTTGFVPVLLLLLLAATFEELGWRGYAFDSLQSRYTFFKASVIFSILWSLWHFPLIFVNDSYQYKIFHENLWCGVNFFVSIIPLGIIISWFCIRNGKSILAAILFHFVVNMSQEALNITQTTKCIETAVLMVVAAGIIAWDKDLFFSNAHLIGKQALPEKELSPDKVR